MLVLFNTPGFLIYVLTRIFLFVMQMQGLLTECKKKLAAAEAEIKVRSSRIVTHTHTLVLAQFIRLESHLCVAV